MDVLECGNDDPGEELDTAIYLAPPEEHGMSDEDSGDEDVVNMNHLQRRILLSEVIPNNLYEDEVEDSCDIANQSIAPAAKRICQQQSSCKTNDFDVLPKRLRQTKIDNATIHELEQEPAAAVVLNIRKRSKRNTQSDVNANIEQHNQNTVPKRGKVETIVKKSTKQRAKNDTNENWIHKRTANKIDTGMWPPLLPPLTLSAESKPHEFLMLFLSEDVIKNLLMYTVLYASQCNHYMEVSIDEIYSMIGIFIVSGYVVLPRKRMYWEKSTDVYNDLVANAMRRNRFDEILKYLHFCDNTDLNPNDKLSKVRPLIDIMNEKFIQYAPVGSAMSIDESMIPYFGRHSCKMYMIGKPIRFGFKAWVLATPNGYFTHFDIYQGKNGIVEVGYEQYGLGEQVVMKNADVLRTNFPDLKFSLFFDNFFTTKSLVNNLSEYGYGGTGTLRANRLNSCQVLENPTQMKKKERGFYDFAADVNNNVNAIRWNDNNVVTILSNQFGIEPLKTVERYSRIKRQRINVPQPNAIQMYNKYMGGVDLGDNGISNYRIGIRGKKWYTPIFFWILDVAITNAWILSRSFGCSLPQLDFRRDCAKYLCEKYGSTRKASGPSKKVVHQNYNHLKHGKHCIVLGQSRLRCALCKNKTTKACDTCNVSLHDKCFAAYHK